MKPCDKGLLLIKCRSLSWFHILKYECQFLAITCVLGCRTRVSFLVMTNGRGIRGSKPYIQFVFPVVSS
jgi:hypothetical protein